MVTVSPDTLMPFSAAMWPRSTRSDGEASRVFMAGISVMPPDRNFGVALLGELGGVGDG